MINLFIALKNFPDNQNQPELRSVFFTNFKGKTTLNINSLHQMKPFDTKIICFGSLNRCQ
jgi:hypothetical protein